MTFHDPLWFNASLFPQRPDELKRIGLQAFGPLLFKQVTYVVVFIARLSTLVFCLVLLCQDL
jgi:hypothetical protein